MDGSQFSLEVTKEKTERWTGARTRKDLHATLDFACKLKRSSEGFSLEGLKRLCVFEKWFWLWEMKLRIEEKRVRKS